MKFTMTPQEALEIQRKQIEHYKRHREDLADVVAKLTDVKGLNLDEDMPVREINKRIPRGGDIEYLCGIRGTME